MEQFVKKWAGQVYGTNVGNLFIALEGDNDSLKGKIRINEPNVVAVYHVVGSYKNDSLLLTGEVSQSTRDDLKFGRITVNGKLGAEGRLRGDWESTIGTGGTFIAYPHDYENANDGSVIDSPTLPFEAHPVNFGTLYLDREDIKKLLEILQADFSSNNIIISYETEGGKVSKYCGDFIKNNPKLQQSNEIKIYAQGNDGKNTFKSVSINLGIFGMNQLRVQGTEENWVLGINSKITTFLKKRSALFTTAYKKFGLSINTIIILAILIFTPDIKPTLIRGIFVTATIFILWILVEIHKKLTPLLKIFNEKPTPFKAAWFRISNAVNIILLTGCGGVLAGYILYKFLHIG